MTTINVKFEVNQQTIKAVSHFLGVTTKKVHEILSQELHREGMNPKSVIAVGYEDNTMAFVVYGSLGHTGDFARDYKNHMMVHLESGKAYTVTPSNRRGIGPQVVEVDYLTGNPLPKEEISK